MFSEYIRREITKNMCNFAAMAATEKEILEAIGKKIAERRKELNMTQEDLAYSADIDRTYVGYVENGRQNVSIAILCKFAKALKMEVKGFFYD